MATIRPTSNARHDDKHRVEFEKLTRDEVAQAVRDMAAMGFSDYGVAQATGLAVEYVRTVLGERAHGKR
jgi:hypothetical protein